MKTTKRILIILFTLLLLLSCSKAKGAIDTPVPTNTTPVTTVEPQEKLPIKTTAPTADSSPILSPTDVSVTETPMLQGELPDDTWEPETSITPVPTMLVTTPSASPSGTGSPIDQTFVPTATPNPTVKPTASHLYELPDDDT